MRRAAFFLASGAAAGALAFAVARDAHAEGPFNAEVAAIVGGGTTPTGHGNPPLVGGVPGVSSPDPLGFGVGARAGVELYGLYFGLETMFYLGSQGSSPYYQNLSSILFGGDVGYSFHLPRVTIRPLVGVGAFIENANPQAEPGGAAPTDVVSVAPRSPNGSYTSLYLQPGITGLVSLRAPFFVGVDANVLVLTSLPEAVGTPAGNDHYVALTFHGQLGARF